MSEPLRGQAARWPLYADGGWHVLGPESATGYRSMPSMTSAAALWANTHGYRFASRAVGDGVAIQLTRKDGRAQQAYWPTREKNAQDKYGIRGGPTRLGLGGIDEFEPPVAAETRIVVEPPTRVVPAPPPVVPVNGRLTSSSMRGGALELVMTLAPDQVSALRKALADMDGES